MARTVSVVLVAVVCVVMPHALVSAGCTIHHCDYLVVPDPPIDWSVNPDPSCDHSHTQYENVTDVYGECSDSDTASHCPKEEQHHPVYGNTMPDVGHVTGGLVEGSQEGDATIIDNHQPAVGLYYLCIGNQGGSGELKVQFFFRDGHINDGSNPASNDDDEDVTSQEVLVTFG